MDVEGAEYPVLDELVKSGVACAFVKQGMGFATAAMTVLTGGGADAHNCRFASARERAHDHLRSALQ
eukprot:scaffold301_cov243-Pinguiococcus_pyrenoidosus.AAC.151